MAEADDKVRGRARLVSDIATVDLHAGEKKTETGPQTAFDRPADRFETVGELGRGGMGRVDDAIDRTLGRPVAIKHMLAMNAVDFARFEREVRITARLEHPGIVPVHEAGRSSDGTPYYVMRRVDGQPLSELVADRKSLAERLQLIPNVLAACDAAGFAHARGIVHRDIKPTNILIGPFGETLLIDWGLARELGDGEQGAGAHAPSDATLTRAGTVAGTPGFMAPEQARGEAVDTRADVFALGATLFYVLSGQLPWGSTSATELVSIAGAGRAPDWKRVPEDVPPDLRAVLEKAMAQDPAQRYPDAGALAADLRRYTLGNLVAAYQYGPLAKLLRYARKHRAAVGVGLISFVVLAIVAVISVRRIVAERDDATAARRLAEARQREATAMADELLVRHARELAATDPAGTIAALRRLRPDSERWREAWAAAANAHLRGIPYGFAAASALDASGTTMKIAPDNRRAFVSMRRTGEMTIYDFVDRTRHRLIDNIGSVGSLTWLDARYIAGYIAQQHTLGFIDTTTGKLITKPQPGDVRDIHSSGGNGKIWVHYLDGNVLEYTAPDAPPATVMTNVEHLDTSPDLRYAIVRRGQTVELWHTGKLYPLPVPARRIWQVIVRDGVAVVADDEELHGWKLVDGKLEVLGHWPRTGRVHFRIIHGMPAAFTPQGLIGFTSNGVVDLEREPPDTIWDSVSGAVMSMADGRIIVRDIDGRFELGKRPHAIRRLDFSNDRRWIAAMSSMGDLLVWDLQPIRPRRVSVGQIEQPIFVRGNNLVVVDMASGLRTVDLATGKSKTLLSDAGPPQWTYSGRHGDFFIVGSFVQQQVSIYDVTRERSLVVRGIVAATGFDDGALLAAADGRLLRWRPGEVEPRLHGRVSSAPSVLAATGNSVVMRFGENEVVHLDTATQTTTRTQFERPVSNFGIDRGGTVWVVSGGKAFQWNIGSDPVEIETPGLVDDVVPGPDATILHTATSLLLVRGNERKLLAVTSNRVAPTGIDDLLVFETPQYDVGFIDLTAGAAVVLPYKKPIGGLIAADRERVVYRAPIVRERDAGVLVWTITVPREPAALRTWLLGITNAKPLASIDAVAYP